MCCSEGKGDGLQQAISSRVPSVVCKGTVTVWLMDSEWFATGSQELWGKRVKGQGLGHIIKWHDPTGSI